MEVELVSNMLIVEVELVSNMLIGIRYLQTVNETILNAFKNNLINFIFWVCFKNIMQYWKNVEPRKKMMVDITSKYS
jgi:hypothetical protein